MGREFTQGYRFPGILKKRIFYLPRILTLSKQVSKQDLYFVNESYEIFGTEVSAREKQGQNSGGPHQGVIGSL